MTNVARVNKEKKRMFLQYYLSLAYAFGITLIWNRLFKALKGARSDLNCLRLKTLYYILAAGLSFDAYDRP